MVSAIIERSDIALTVAFFGGGGQRSGRLSGVSRG